MESQQVIDYSTKRIEPAEFATRIAKVQEQLRSRGLEVGLAYATEHMPGDVQYLTGYDPHLENVALLVLPDQAIGLGGAEGSEMFADSARAGVWRNLKQFEIPFQDYGDVRFWTLDEVLMDTLGHLPEEIGLLSAPNVLSHEVVEMVRQAAGGRIHLRNASEILAEARYRKSPAELEMHRTSSQIATEAMRAMLEAVKPGVRELEVAAYGDYIIKSCGAYGYGFDTMVCSGPRINTIIGRSTNRVIEKGDMVMLGASPRYEGYTSALGRAAVAGGANKEQAGFLDHGIRAYELAVERLVVDRPARDVDLAARNYLRSVGLGRYHAYGIGHGIGLTECLEEKTATAVSDYNLPTGITMMIDVGLFGHPKFFGSRHEDPYLINLVGITEKLTVLPMRVYT